MIKINEYSNGKFTHCHLKTKNLETAKNKLENIYKATMFIVAEEDIEFNQSIKFYHEGANVEVKIEDEKEDIKKWIIENLRKENHVIGLYDEEAEEYRLSICIQQDLDGACARYCNCPCTHWSRAKEVEQFTNEAIDEIIEKGEK